MARAAQSGDLGLIAGQFLAGHGTIQARGIERGISRGPGGVGAIDRGQNIVYTLVTEDRTRCRSCEKATA